MSYVADTEFLFSLRPKDRSTKPTRKILRKVRQHGIQVRLLESAVQEMRAVLFSQGKSHRDAYRSLILIKTKLTKHGILEEPTTIDDYILADKLREEHAELTYFDSLHAAAALRLNTILLTNDNVYARCEVKTITFEELAR